MCGGDLERRISCKLEVLKFVVPSYDFYFLQTCNGFHQSPIDVIFTGTPVDDASNAENGALTFVGYDTADNKLKNKGGKTVVSKLYIPVMSHEGIIGSIKNLDQKDCKRTLFIILT